MVDYPAELPADILTSVRLEQLPCDRSRRSSLESQPTTGGRNHVERCEVLEDQFPRLTRDAHTVLCYRNERGITLVPQHQFSIAEDQLDDLHASRFEVGPGSAPQ